MTEFLDALAHVLRSEGGYVDHPADPGGATNRGVTQAVYTAWLADQGRSSSPVRDIAGPEVEAIYRDRYWNPSRADALPWPASLWHFDAAVNSGVHRAACLLQEAVKVAQDGALGPITLAAVTAIDRDELLRRLRWGRLRFYARIVVGRPRSAAFLLGWLRRIEELEKVR